MEQNRKERFRYSAPTYLFGALNALARLSKTQICLYDNTGWMGMEASSIPDSRVALHRHCCTYCAYIRTLPGGREMCINEDVIRGQAVAFHCEKPQIHTCYAGVTEVIVPVIWQKKLLGTVFCGQCRLDSATDETGIFAHISHLTRHFDEWLAAYRTLPKVEQTTLKDAGELIQAIFLHYIYEFAMCGAGEEMLLAEPSYAKRARAYISEHFHEAISPKDIALALHVTPAHLARVFKAEMGISLSNCLSQARLAKALEYLSFERMSIHNIAINLGFSDQNYFSRWFKQLIGESPTDYRAKISKKF